MKPLLPFNPVHPGGLIRREFEAREITLEQAAVTMGIAVAEAEAILQKKAPVTPAIAERLENAWDIDASTWLTMQERYDTHPKTHGGARAGAGAKKKAETGTLRYSVSLTDAELVKDFLEHLPKGQRAQLVGEALLKGIQVLKTQV